MEDKVANEKPAPPLASPRGGPQSGILIYLPNRLLLALCALQFVLLIALVLVNRVAPRQDQPAANAPASPPAAPAAESPERYYQGSPGPWGKLEFTRINIEPPDEFAAEDQFPPRRWFFAGYTRSQLAALFDTCELAAPRRAELLDQASWTEQADGIFVTPTEQLVLEMNPRARAQIYSVLAESPQNDLQFYPYCFRNGGFDDWFQRSGLSDATLALVRRMVYQRGSTLCFSDVPEVWAKIPGAAERQRLAKTLGRNATVLMKLRVDPETDVRALIDYWSEDGRAKDVQPLLESLTLVPGGMTIDIVHLLPPFARKRLYTFPEPAATNRAPDCYWTAMNFFNDPADNRYFDDAIWRAELQSDYTVVRKPTYGDLVFLTRPDGVPIHAAVYIADDVVFTKNGANYGQPWMLVKMEDLLARYPETSPVRVAIFHLKSRPGPSGGEER